MGGKGENLVAVVVFVNSGSVQRSNTVSSSPETPIVVVVSCNVEDAKLLIQVSLVEFVCERLNLGVKGGPSNGCYSKTPVVVVVSGLACS